jgi:parvulin-like peptidyl-prolyl isomerase
MRRGKLALLVAGAVLLSGLSLWRLSRAPEPASSSGQEGVIALVGDKPMTVANLALRLAELGAKSPQEAHAAIRAALDEAIDTTLLTEEAKRLNLVLTAEELERLRADEPPAHLLEPRLAAQGQTLAAYRSARERSLLASRVIERQVYAALRVTDEELAAHVAAHRERFRSPERYRLHAIFVSSPAGQEPGLVAGARKRIEQAEARLKQRQRFEKIAETLSDDLSGARGGELGARAPGERPLDEPEVLQAVLQLGDGQVSGILTSPEGFWLIRRDAHLAPADLPLEEVRARAEAEYRRERGQSLAVHYRRALRERAGVKILLPEPEPSREPAVVSTPAGP